MKSAFNTRDPNKSIQRAMISLQTRAFLRKGGKIQQIPDGHTAESVSMTLRQYSDLTALRMDR